MGRDGFVYINSRDTNLSLEILMIPVAPTESVEKGHPHGEGVVSFRWRETATHSTTGKNFTKDSLGKLILFGIFLSFPSSKGSFWCSLVPF